MSQPKQYVPSAEIAKMVRAQLKLRFPGVVFSVRKRPGGSIDVAWVDGPIERDVADVVEPFGGAGFDGMIDGSYVKQPWYCPEHGARLARVYGHGQGLDGEKQPACCGKAEQINSLADYVFAKRQYSPEFRAQVEADVSEKYGMPYHADVNVGGQYMSSWFHQEAYQRAAAPGGKPQVW
jgi:hypothetical protein